MSIDIAAMSDVEQASFKAALGAMGYFVPIDSPRAQLTPVEYVDIQLPMVGYDWFRLVGVGFASDPQDALAAAFSYDGGVTFINDVAHLDSYNIISVSPDLNTPPSMVYGEGADAVMSLSGFGAPIILVADIFAGSATRYPVLNTHMSLIPNVLSHPLVPWYQGNIVNGNSNAAPSTARANVIRVLPYGNGDVNPPTSGTTFTFESISLFGCPAVT